MRRTLRLFALAGLALLGAWAAGDSYSQESPATAKSARGGILAKTAQNQFEVFFTNRGLRIYVTTPTGAPISTLGLTGTATFYHPRSPKAWFSRPLASAQGGRSLDVVIGLKSVPVSGVKVAFMIQGLPDAAAQTASFTVPFEFYVAASVSPGEAATAPRFVYGLGSEGYGYYPSAGTAAMAAVRSRVYAAPTNGAPASAEFAARRRDWTTGRDNLPISKPWLRPQD